MPTRPWPDKQAGKLDRLLKHLADEANDAQLAALHEPTSWPADRYEVLVRDLWRQADNARREGPGEGPITNSTTPADKPEEDKTMAKGWPKPQAEQLDRLVQALDDFQVSAQQHNPYTPAQDKFVFLVGMLNSLASMAEVDGPDAVERLPQMYLDNRKSVYGEPETDKPEPPAHEVKGRNLTFTMDALGNPKPTS